MVRSTRRLLRPRHRRSGGFLSAAALALVLVGAAAPAAAQQPTRPDTTRRPPAGRVPPDTARPPAADTGAVQDTGAARVPRDTTPPPQLPSFPRPVPAGFSTGVWVFDRDAIERLGTAMSLADLLETIPGMVRLRSGYFLQPDQVASLGGTAGRVQVFLDGYELTPVSGGTVDLSRIELTEVANVRVERRLGALRIELRSQTPSTPQPYAYIEALIGQPNSKLFRGVFLAPHFLLGPVAFGVERLDTDGTHRREPANATSAWGKWGRIWRNKGGIQAEYRTSTTHRNSGNPATDVPWLGTYARSDWTVRGRWQFVPGVVAEAYFGSTSAKDRNLIVPDTGGMGVPLIVNVVPAPVLDTLNLPQDSLARDSALAQRHAVFDSLLAEHKRTSEQARDTLIDVSDHQIGGRLGILRGPFWADGALRTHSAPRLPETEGDGRLGFVLAGMGDVDGGLHLEKWSSRQVSETSLRGRLGPRAGFSAFAEVTSGERGVPFLSDNRFRGTDGQELFTRRSGWRAGVDLERSWISGGIARISLTTDSMPGFGLPFDPAAAYAVTGSMAGWESHARLRLFWKPLSAEYWYVGWTQFKFPASADTAARQPIYVPDQLWRASLVYHHSPLASGHLELYARVDARSRGVMYDAVRSTSTDGAVAAVNSFDLYVQIRIMDLRIYFENRNFNQNKTVPLTDFPTAFGREVPGPRIFYGVRWQFFD